jgi:hypothetical protein
MRENKKSGGGATAAAAAAVSMAMAASSKEASKALRAMARTQESRRKDAVRATTLDTKRQNVQTLLNMMVCFTPGSHEHIAHIATIRAEQAEVAKLIAAESVAAAASVSGDVPFEDDVLDDVDVGGDSASRGDLTTPVFGVSSSSRPPSACATTDTEHTGKEYFLGAPPAKAKRTRATRLQMEERRRLQAQAEAEKAEKAMGKNKRAKDDDPEYVPSTAQV